MKLFYILIIILLLGFSGCVEIREYRGNNINAGLCYESVNKRVDDFPSQYQYDTDLLECDNIEKIESQVFYLKEMKQKDLSQSELSGSFLLIAGSIYGKVEDKMYLVITYFNPDISAYKITKFELEQIQINTIDKNENAYFKYKVDPYKVSAGNRFHYDRFIPVLYLPDGWMII